jgi:phosphoribosylanthranilate isomerase
MLKTLVKANSITNLTDARYFAAWEVNWLGFCLDPDSPDFINHAQALAIREWVDSVEMVGEFGAQEASFIAQTAEKLQLDAIQLSRTIPQEWLSELPKIPIIQELTPYHDISSGELQAQLMAYGPHVSYFLLDFTRSRLSWEEIQEDGAPLPVGLLRSFCSEYPILLSFDWTPANLEEILFHLAPSGICIKGGAEEKTGFKSFEEMDALFEALQVDE